VLTSKVGYPDSATVGTAGKVAIRLVAVTAMARSRPEVTSVDTDCEFPK